MIINYDKAQTLYTTPELQGQFIDYLRGLDSTLDFSKFDGLNDQEIFQQLTSTRPEVNINANNPEKDPNKRLPQAIYKDLSALDEQIQSKSLLQKLSHGARQVLDQINPTTIRDKAIEDNVQKRNEIINDLKRAGITSERLAKEYGISPFLQDTYFESQDIFSNVLDMSHDISAALLGGKSAQAKSYDKQLEHYNTYKSIAQKRLDNPTTYHTSLTPEEQAAIDEGIGAFSAWIRGNDGKAKADLFFDIQNAKESASNFVSAQKRLENVQADEQLLGLIGTLKHGKDFDKKQKAMLEDYAIVAKELGFDTLAYNKTGLYFIKDEKAYKVEQTLWDDIKGVFKDNMGSLAGAIAGAEYGFKKKGFKGMVAYGAAGAFGGGVSDSMIADVLANKQIDFAQALLHGAQEGAFNLAADAVLKVAGTAIKTLNPEKLKNIAGTAIDYTPVLGFISRAHDGNKAAAQKLIDTAIPKEVQANLKELETLFGAEVQIGQASTSQATKALEAIKQKLGEESFIAKGAQKLYDTFAFTEQKSAQKDFIRAIRADENGNLTAFLSEAANASPTIQKSLQQVLDTTTQKLLHQLGRFNLQKNTIKEVFNNFEQGTKQSYKQAIEDILQGIYDDTYTTILSKESPNIPQAEQASARFNTQSYNDFKQKLHDSGVMVEDSAKFLHFVEKNIYNPKGVTFESLNNALKTINAYHKQASDPNFRSFVKDAVNGFIKRDIQAGIEAIFMQNKALYSDARTLFDTALSDYAKMKETLKLVDKLKVRDRAKSYEQVAESLSRFFLAQGDKVPNFEALLGGLQKELREQVEIRLLQDMLELSLVRYGESSALDSSEFFKRLDPLKAHFQSKSAQDFIAIAQDFHTLFRNDAKILSALAPATTEKMGSSIATTLEGAIKFQVIKALFANVVRLLPHIPFAKGLNEKVQGAALRFHLKKALDSSLSVGEFKLELQARAIKGDFTNATREQIAKILGQVDSAQESLEQAITPSTQAKPNLHPIDSQEAKELAEHFHFKGAKPLVREARENEIAHALKSHGDETTEAQRGNIAITRADIETNYPKITQEHDEKFYTDTGVIYVKQVNGHHIAIEEALLGQDKLIFKTMWKTKGNYNKEVLLKNAKASPYPHNADEAAKSESISNPSLEQGSPLQSHQSTSNSTTLSPLEQAQAPKVDSSIEHFGQNFSEYKGQGAKAVEKVLQERSGQVQGAFHRDDLGEIDVVWGEVQGSGKRAKGWGLAKIIEKHLNAGDFKAFGEGEAGLINAINEIIGKGKLIKDGDRATLRYVKDGEIFKLGLKGNWHGEPTQNKWIITTYKDEREMAKTIDSSDFTKSETLPFNSSGNSTTLSPLAQAQAQKRAEQEAQEAAQQAQRQAEQEAAQAIKDKNDQIQSLKDSRAGKSEMEREVTLGQPIAMKHTEQPPTSIATDDNNIYQLDFVIVKASDVKPNFNADGLQPRTQKEHKTIESIARDFKPEMVLGRGGYKDLPIIAKDGQVITGNHRVQGFKDFSPESRAAYEKAIKDRFNIELASDELLLRTPSDDLSVKELLGIAYNSNKEDIKNLGDHIYSVLGRYAPNFAKLPRQLESSSVQELKSKIARILDPSPYPNENDANLALLANTIKADKNANITEMLNAFSKLDKEDADKTLSTFTDTAGLWHILSNNAVEYGLKQLDLRPYLLGAMYKSATSQHTTRAANFKELNEQIKHILDTTDSSGSNAMLVMMPNTYDNLIADLLGASLARFMRLENPSANLYEALKGANHGIREQLAPRLDFETGFTTGRNIEQADIFDFIEYMIRQGEGGKEVNEAVQLLPKLREKYEAFKGFTPPPSTTPNKPKETPEPTEKQAIKETNADSSDLQALRDNVEQTLESILHKDIQNTSTGITAQISRTSIKKMTSAKAIQKSLDNGFTKEQHFSAAQNIQELYENAQHTLTRGDDKNGDKAVILHEFISAIPNTEAAAKILVKESLDKDLRRIYTLELQELIPPLPTNPRTDGSKSGTHSKSLQESGAPLTPLENASVDSTTKTFNQNNIKLEPSTQPPKTPPTPTRKPKPSISQEIKDIIDSSPQKGRDMQIIGEPNFTPQVVEYAHKNNKKVAIDKLEQAEAKKLGFKYPNDVRVTIDYQAINHTLNRHGADSNLVKESGQKAVDYSDIAEYRSIVKSADESLESVDNLGQEVIVSFKQINGHAVVVESIRKKGNELAFKSMYFENGSYKNSNAYKNAVESPKGNPSPAPYGYEPHADANTPPLKTDSTIIPQQKPYTDEKKTLQGFEQAIAGKDTQTPPAQKGLFDEVDSSDIIFTDKKGKEHTLTQEVQEQWLNTFNLKSLDESYTPQLPQELQETIGKEIRLTKGSLYKIIEKGREQYIPQIKETLEKPQIVLQDENELIFAKQIKDDLYLTSIGKDFDTHITIISNSPKTDKTIQNKLKNGKVIYEAKNAEALPTSGAFTETNQVPFSNNIIPQPLDTLPTPAQNLIKKLLHQIRRLEKSPSFREHDKIIAELKKSNDTQMLVNLLKSFDERFPSAKDHYLLSGLRDSIQTTLNKLSNPHIAKVLHTFGEKKPNHKAQAQAIKELYQHYGDESLKDLFDKVLSAAGDVKFSIRQTYANANGKYSADKHLITLNRRWALDIEPQRLAQTLLHELIHATIARAQYHRFSPQAFPELAHKLTPAQKAAVQEIDDLYILAFKTHQAQKRAKTLADDELELYGFTNSKEFVAELANPKFRSYLEKQNIFKRVLNAIIKFFTGGEGEQTNILKALQESYEKYLDNFGESSESFFAKATQTTHAQKSDDLVLFDRDSSAPNFTYTTGEAKGIAELRKDLKQALEPYKSTPITNKETGLQGVVTTDEINKIASKKAVDKSVANGFSRDEHFTAAQHLKNLFENSKFKESHADNKHRENIAQVHRFVKDLYINDKQAQAKITLFEKIEGKNRIYTLELESLNKPDSLSASVPNTESAAKAQSVATARPETTTIAKTDKHSIAQDLQTPQKVDSMLKSAQNAVSLENKGHRSALADVSLENKRSAVSLEKTQGQRVEIAIPKEKDFFKNLRNKAKETLAARKGEKVQNISSGMSASVSSDGISKMISSKAVDKSINNGYTKEEHFASVENVLSLFKISDLANSEKPNNKSVDVIAYHKFIADFSINHKPTKAKITLRETLQAGNRIYSLELLELEKASN